MDSRLYAISQEYFTKKIAPLIRESYKRIGRPSKTGDYVFFCGVLYVLRTGISWRDLPRCFGVWHTVYTRFKRWSENGLFWSLLYKLQQQKCVAVEMIWVDSTTISLHRHGGGPLKKRLPIHRQRKKRIKY